MANTLNGACGRRSDIDGEAEGRVSGSKRVNLFRNGVVGLIDWLDAQSATSVMFKDRHDCDEQKPRTKQEQT